jgi:dimethylamine/trimethylamine dehydrogenase
VVFDDDNFYLGGVIAEKLRGGGHVVTLVTTEAMASAWTVHTLEQHRIQSRLLELGVKVIAKHNLSRIGSSHVDLACSYSDAPMAIPAVTVVMVTSRRPNNELCLALAANEAGLARAGIASLQAVGDCDVPSTIADAVYDGHRVARELDAPPAEPDLPFRREAIALEGAV